MNRFRKALCVALVLLLLVASVPAVPVADLGFGITASALNATGKCGKNATYTFDSATGELVISGTGAIAAEAFVQNKEIKNVIIGDGITEIGADAFAVCYYLTNVDIPYSVTTIGSSAFCNCDYLTNVDIPDGVTTIGSGVFMFCNKLSRVGISNNVTTISREAFAGCTGLTSVDIPDSVTTIGDKAFSNCSGLESVNIPKSVTYIGEEAFRYCPSLTDVYYEGAEENWNAINIDENNTGLENAEIHFAETHTHTWDVEEITKYPTCTEKGEKTISCKGAVCKKIEELPMKEHDCYVSYQADPTCTVNGYIKYRCNYCDYSYAEDIEAPGHNFVDYYSNNDATCKEDGTKTATCNRCWGEKDTIVDEGSKDKVAHKFDNGKCTVCGAYADSCQHNNLAWYDGYDATCTSEGFKEHYECKDCYKYLDSNKEVIDKNDLIISIIPHDVEGVEYRKYDDVYHSKKCNMCGIDVALANHNYDVVISKTFPTCVTTGLETRKCACGDTITEMLPANDNHDWGEWEVYLAPTCTASGSKERACKREGCTAKEVSEIFALGHDMWLISSIVPNCWNIGNNKYYACDRCDKFFKDEAGTIETTVEAETLAKTEHKFTYYRISKDATCTSNAFEIAVCDNCKEATHEREIVGTMIAHSFKDYKSDGNATCKVDGTMTAVCEMCKEAKDTKTEVDSHKTAPHYPDITGTKCTLCGEMLVCLHTYSAEKLITKTPTCTTDGQKAIVCSKCNANKPGSEEVVAKTGHAWGEGEVIKAASCQEEGKIKYKCNNMCGETKEETVEKTDHNYKEVITHATCTTDGYSTFTCTMCASRYVDNKVVKYGHIFDAYVHDEGSSTCYMDGTKTAECAHGCGTKNTVDDPDSKLDHQLAEFVVVVAPTCTTSGEREAKCKNYDKCNYVEYAKIPALGHAYIAMENGDFVCTRCGAVNGNPTPDTGDHTYPDQWSVIIPATCKETGVAVKVCFDCHEVIAMVVPKAGHSDFDGDSKCDTCGGTITVVEPERPAEKPEEKPCNCDCHAGGIKAFFFKLINFFAKIFDKNARVCDCGKAH